MLKDHDARPRDHHSVECLSSRAEELRPKSAFLQGYSAALQDKSIVLQKIRKADSSTPYDTGLRVCRAAADSCQEPSVGCHTG